MRSILYIFLVLAFSAHGAPRTEKLNCPFERIVLGGSSPEVVVAPSEAQLAPTVPGSDAANPKKTRTPQARESFKPKQKVVSESETHKQLRRNEEVIQAHGYELGKYVASGGEGTVRVAKDSGGKTVIIKQAVEEGAMLRLQKEHELLSDIHKSKDPRTKYFPTSDLLVSPDGKTRVLVLDFFAESEGSQTPSRSLHEWIQDGQFGNFSEPGSSVRASKKERQQRRLKIAEQMIEALEFLHSLDPPIIHRDIKPSNVIVNAKGELKIIDFGVAAHRGSDSGVGFAVGTVDFMSFEAATGKSPSEKMDVHSLQVTLKHMLGQREGNPAGSVMQQWYPVIYNGRRADVALAKDPHAVELDGGYTETPNPTDKESQVEVIVPKLNRDEGLLVADRVFAMVLEGKFKRISELKEWVSRVKDFSEGRESLTSIFRAWGAYVTSEKFNDSAPYGLPPTHLDGAWALLNSPYAMKNLVQFQFTQKQLKALMRGVLAIQRLTAVEARNDNATFGLQHKYHAAVEFEFFKKQLMGLIEGTSSKTLDKEVITYLRRTGVGPRRRRS